MLMINKKMSDLGKLVLFAIFIGIIITALFSILYCGYVFLCRMKRPKPLANTENQV